MNDNSLLWTALHLFEKQKLECTRIWCPGKWDWFHRFLMSFRGFIDLIHIYVIHQRIASLCIASCVTHVRCTYNICMIIKSHHAAHLWIWQRNASYRSIMCLLWIFNNKFSTNFHGFRRNNPSTSQMLQCNFIAGIIYGLWLFMRKCMCPREWMKFIYNFSHIQHFHVQLILCRSKVPIKWTTRYGGFAASHHTCEFSKISTFPKASNRKGSLKSRRPKNRKILHAFVRRSRRYVKINSYYNLKWWSHISSSI